MNILNCPCCNKRASVDAVQRKTCVNIECEDNYGIIYFHHHWVELHEDLKKSLTVENQVNQLMLEF